MDLNKESNGFLDCVKTIEILAAGTCGIFRVINGKVYDFSLKVWKEAYDKLCDEKGGKITYQEYLDYLNAHFLRSDLDADMMRFDYIKWLNEKDVLKQIAERKSELKKEYRADYENACDDLYFGYGYKFWRDTAKHIESEEDAKLLWQAAIEKMANS